jgi:thymidylate synthase (FAD)
MKIVKPSFEILTPIDGEEVLRRIELAGRVCYKSEDKITPESARKFVAGILKSGHESVIEHESVSVRVVCDRGVSHEIVRHRIASYSQESTRYCNYCKDKFDGQITFIEPCFWPVSDENRKKWLVWTAAMKLAEEAYLTLLEHGATPQEARSVLPNSLKTEIVMTMNMREWRHFFRLRTSPKAHPQMVEIAKPMLAEFKRLIPILFEEL